MEYTFSEKENTANVSIYGNITPSSRPFFLEVVEKFTNSGKAEWIVDLEEVEYLDSHGLGMLVELNDNAKKTSAKIAVVGANDLIIKLFKLSKFDTMFEIRA